MKLDWDPYKSNLGPYGSRSLFFPGGLQISVGCLREFEDYDKRKPNHWFVEMATVGPLPPKWRTSEDFVDGGRPKEIDVDWAKVDATQFYATIPLMSDARQLWSHVLRHTPTILTGVPKIGKDQASANKRGWVNKHLGEEVPVITCLSREKSVYCRPGDIIIDDWEKYKHLWVQKGGVWITHTNAVDTISKLRELGL